MTDIIDLTPTWKSLVNTFIMLIENGTAEGRAIAIKEITRMAQIADGVVACEAARATMILNCMPEGDTIADLARRDHLQGFSVAFSKSVATNPDDRESDDCPPEQAEFATIYARNDLGEEITLHDVDLTNAGADSLAQACRAIFAAILNASRATEIR